MLPIRSLLNATRTISRRQISTTLMRRSGHGEGEGVIGSNLPFSINNRYRLTLYFILFFGSGFSLPFILVRHHLTK